MDEGILVLPSFWDGVNGVMSKKQAASEQVQGRSPSGLFASSFRATPGPMKVQPREMTSKEEAALMPEIMAMTNATMAASRMTPADFDPYRGQFIAWSPDGKHILAHAKDSDTLDQKLNELGVDISLCVIQFVHDIQYRI